MRKVCVFDPTVASLNLGDQIIARAINSELDELLPDAFRVTVPTHDYTFWPSRQLTKDCEIRFVGGSNLLKSRMFWNAQWKLTPLDPFLLKDVLLFGCGWRNYQSSPEFVTRVMLASMLTKRFVHSVRDSYTLSQLKSAGIENVLNTGCPTMWRLDPTHCARIPATKSDTVVFTLTEYAKNPVSDRAMVQALRENYKKVFFFGQQPSDFQYLQDLDVGQVMVLPPSLHAYDRFLTDHTVDYVGTRLHGGIFALQHGRRSLIVEVDNRAAEITKDTGLPVIARNNIGGLADWISGARPTSIRLATNAIALWRNQFSNDAPTFDRRSLVALAQSRQPGDLELIDRVQER